jgi:hypothetical protein
MPTYETLFIFGLPIAVLILALVVGWWFLTHRRR